MGVCVSSDVREESARILMLGIDSSGKTTLLYRMKLGQALSAVTTVGFNVETVTPAKGVSFTVWDVGGQARLRPLWRHYYTSTQGLLYVVDSADPDRLGESRKELMKALSSAELKGVPIVVFANKQDKPNAVSVAEVTEQLGLTELNDRKWHIQGACAVSGQGVQEGMMEMARFLKESDTQGEQTVSSSR